MRYYQSTQIPSGIGPGSPKFPCMSHIDLLGPHSITYQCYYYALTTVCNLTGYLMTSPIKDKKTTVATHLVLDIMHKFGFARILHSDNGTEFKYKLIEHLSQQLGIKKTYISPHHL